VSKGESLTGAQQLESPAPTWIGAGGDQTTHIIGKTKGAPGRWRAFLFGLGWATQWASLAI
jgi:hypothetical protein